MSGGTAFDGHVIHAVRFADIQTYRTRLYSKWCTLQNPAQLAAQDKPSPDWPTFRDSNKEAAPRASTAFRRYAAVAIEPAGSGTKRRTKIGGA